MNIYFCKYWLRFCLIVFVFGSCDTKSQKKMESPEGYDFSSGKKLLLFGKLEEISGIAFLPDSDTILMAVNDEEGRVYEVNINNPKFKADPFEFAGKGDYEDITFYKGLWQVLHSNGTIYAGDLITPEWPKPPKIFPPAFPITFPIILEPIFSRYCDVKPTPSVAIKSLMCPRSSSKPCDFPMR